jgi:hypothetical protein
VPKAQTGWLFKFEIFFEPPPRRFAPPLLSRRGDSTDGLFQIGD